MVLCFLLITIAMVLAASPAHAQQGKPLAAGDTITNGDNECTLGYVYRVHGHTMGVSAGHCADRDADDAPVLDTDAGVTGRSVSMSRVAWILGGGPW